MANALDVVCGQEQEAVAEEEFAILKVSHVAEQARLQRLFHQSRFCDAFLPAGARSVA